MKQTGLVVFYLLAFVLFVGAARLPVGGAVATLVSFTAMGFAGTVFLMYLAGCGLAGLFSGFWDDVGTGLRPPFAGRFGPMLWSLLLGVGPDRRGLARDRGSAAAAESAHSSSVVRGRASRVELDFRFELGCPACDDRRVLGGRATHVARFCFRALLRMGLLQSRRMCGRTGETVPCG